MRALWSCWRAKRTLEVRGILIGRESCDTVCSARRQRVYIPCKDMRRCWRNILIGLGWPPIKMGDLCVYCWVRDWNRLLIWLCLTLVYWLRADFVSVCVWIYMFNVFCILCMLCDALAQRRRDHCECALSKHLCAHISLMSISRLFWGVFSFACVNRRMAFWGKLSFAIVRVYGCTRAHIWRVWHWNVYVMAIWWLTNEYVSLCPD